MKKPIPTPWLLPFRPERIICHWTAGGYYPSGLDKAHYHILVDGDAALHRGDTPINQRASHTYMLNTNSIGLSCCCMGGAQGRQAPGPYPLLRKQWEKLIQVTAQLCIHYNLRPVEEEVLMHGDVHRVYGIDQWGKWDINFLPWEPNLAHDEVGHLFRKRVKEAMQERTGVTVVVNGKKLTEQGVLENGSTLLPVRAVAEALGLNVDWDGSTKTVSLDKPKG